MTDLIPVTFLQLDTIWENPEQNRKNISGILDGKDLSGHILVLPEMFTTGFTMSPEKVAEEMNGTSVKWMQKQAELQKCVMMGSLVINTNTGFMNRLIWVRPDGELQFYDKRHLFRMGEEDAYYQAGNRQVIFEYLGWRIRPLICYDLRFPVWSRNKSNYDLLIYVANWPESRRKVWLSLLVARALENQVYVVGVNRVGMDGRNLSYSGDSVVIDPRGEVLIGPEPNREGINSAMLSLKKLRDFQEKFPVHLDADDFQILI